MKYRRAGEVTGLDAMNKPELHMDPSPTLADQLAGFALDLSWDAIPEEVVGLAKAHFLDALGIALASSVTDFGKSVLNAAMSMGQADQATAVGSGVRLPATSAALVNGTLAHGLDFDDTHIAAIYHASAPALAAALAAGEAGKADGRTLLTGFVVGLEIGCRLAEAANGAFHDRGFHPTSQCGTFAAAAVSARLQGDSRESLRNALGLCGSMASGVLELRESWLKRLHPGWAAHAGLSAAALGRAGFRGPATVLEGPHGFYMAHIERVPEGTSSPVFALGRRWTALGLALKPYPCCHFIHAFVDAALFLREKLDIGDIARIDCPLTARLHSMVAEPRSRRIVPPTIYDALFSVPYIVAVALVKGRVDLAAFYDEPLDDPQILDLAARIHCSDDPASDYPRHFPGELRIILKDGRELRRREATSRGTPERRLSRAEVEEKFFSLATRAIDRDAAAAIARAVWNIERLEDVGSLLLQCIGGGR